MRKLLLAVTVMLALAPAANAAPNSWPLHPGSHGPKTAALQWLLAGHKPNVYAVQPTFHVKVNGGFGARTKSAVVIYKNRIGYPKAGQCGAKTSMVVAETGPQFFAILEGKKARPLCWIGLAQKRTRIVVPGATKLALKIKALEVSQIGIREIPDGSNRGPHISQPWPGYPSYQSVTGAVAAPWCASFQQWAFSQSGDGTFADRSAGVLYIESWAHQHGYVDATANVGSLVAFLDDGGHIGYVVKVMAAGYVSLEGNSNNSVREVYHPWNDRLRVFIDLPGVVK